MTKEMTDEAKKAVKVITERLHMNQISYGAALVAFDAIAVAGALALGMTFEDYIKMRAGALMAMQEEY